MAPKLLLSLLLLSTSLLFLTPHTAHAQNTPTSTLIQTLQNPDSPKTLSRTQNTLIQRGPKAIPTLLKSLQNTKLSDDTRGALAFVIGEICARSKATHKRNKKGNPDQAKLDQARTALQTLWTSSKDASYTLRIPLATALGSLKELDPLRSFLNGSDPILIAKASMNLASLRDKDSIPAIQKHLSNTDIRPFLAIALGRLRDPSGKNDLQALLKGEEVFRDFAAVALGHLGERNVIYQLRFALENQDVFIRREAALLLGSFEDIGAMESIEKRLQSETDPRVRNALSRTQKRLKRAKRKRR